MVVLAHLHDFLIESKVFLPLALCLVCFSHEVRLFVMGICLFQNKGSHDWIIGAFKKEGLPCLKAIKD